MKVIGAQLSATTNKEQNLQKAIKAIEEAKSDSADLILFPEMYMCNTSDAKGPSPADISEPLDGPFVSALSKAAKANQIYVICGIYEFAEDSNLPYNSVITLNKNGKLISNYRKTHLCDSWNVNESDVFTAGKEPFEVLDTEFGKIGIIICYELRFPEISRFLTLHDIDILLVPAAWYSGSFKEEHWQILTRARAIENTVFICAVNQPQDPFCGRSIISDPMGVVISSAGTGEGLITGTIDLHLLKDIRQHNPCLNNIVKGIYS